MDEAVWAAAPWYGLDHHILGEVPIPQDFSGRYKLLWGQDRLYLLAEIVDDVLYDSHPDPLSFYWDDDCLEVFVDEDASGGLHQYDFNAFAYHIALDNQAVDIGGQRPDGSPEFILLNDHVNSAWQRSESDPRTIVWEVALKIFGDNYQHGDPGAQPVPLKAGKKMGFMLAYCDNDGSDEREHFMGSHAIQAVDGDKNRGYIDASVFGKIILQ
ncbi:sugar-binding protein [Biformimicrobium ophioploci]|uniref:Carbohydrate-binding domain-containing protein n=1 Tax=Biformimicrobium ophioploci TaxID=3036711 RepID=A0ABQ6M0T3_9GAMM|nr:sugar-binding protein [Microbulbifer sp. NKW57]GMG87956.1 hypothetical protein MNKW57_22770 [Microbulbifer sp. NKW57]